VSANLENVGDMRETQVNEPTEFATLEAPMEP